MGPKSVMCADTKTRFHDCLPIPPSTSDSGAFGCQFLSLSKLLFWWRILGQRPGFDRPSRAVCVDEDALGRASRLDQGEAARRNAVLEQPFSFAEDYRKDPHAIFVDEFGGDQRLQQFTAAPDMQRRPIRCLQPANLVHDITAYVQRLL